VESIVIGNSSPPHCGPGSAPGNCHGSGSASRCSSCSTWALSTARMVSILHRLSKFCRHRCDDDPLIQSPSVSADSGQAWQSLLCLATAHAAIGSVAEIAGLYILLAVGTKVLPEKFRIARYKLWMRSVLALWWMVLLSGIATYIRWYIPLAVSR